MTVTRLAQDALLAPLVEAGEAEGFEFTRRLQLELAAGDFTQLGAALFGSFSGTERAGTELTGVGGLTPDPYPDAEPDTGRLRHLYVLPRYRRLGIGRKLVTAIVGEAAQHYPVLRLRTTTQDAARFYETLDFTAAAEPNATHVLALK